jgi:hypothetical protein
VRGLRVVLLLLVAACSLRDPPATKRAEPLPAEPELALKSMDTECDALVTALAAYKTCEHLEDEDRENIDAWIETANRNFAASRKAKPEPKAQTAIAGACRRAAVSVQFANQRCLAGPRPKPDF